VLMEHRPELDRVSEALLDRESLGFDDLVELIGKPVVRAYVEEAASDDLAIQDTVDEKTIKGSDAASAGASESEDVPLESETLLEKPEDQPDGDELS
jgi:hypothetical protein